MSSKHVIGIATAAGLAGVAYLLWRGAQGAGESAGKAAVELPKGFVLGISDAIGIPRPTASKCAAAIQRGSRWDASFACDVPTFARYLVSGREAALKSLNATANPYAPGEARAEYVTKVTPR
ncbi:MAG: hypothetical protein C0434_17700 [Xanthomonadaceae bacterium]|nr:hypothetical protein [Xanthomonadaceae bacterium]